MEEHRKLWIVIIVLACVVLGGGICCCLSIGWLLASQPEYDVDMESARREGERDGASGTTEACLRDGYARTSRCSTAQFDCINVERSYVISCLGTVPEPDPDLCVGAPAHPGLLSDPQFTADLCARYGWGETRGCYDIAAAVETHCASNALDGN